MSVYKQHKEVHHPRRDDAAFLAQFGSGAPVLPPGPFAEVYRIAGYQDGLVGGKEPECDVLAPHWDQEGLTWADENNPKPDDWLWDGGVAAGIPWDGSFYRDLGRYGGSGPLFWASYLKPGSVAGMQGGFWINFGQGWSHLHEDDPGQILSGASQRIFWDVAALSERGYNGAWRLVIEATMFVSFEVVDVWSGVKAGGNDPSGVYARVSGLDPVESLSVVAG